MHFILQIVPLERKLSTDRCLRDPLAASTRRLASLQGPLQREHQRSLDTYSHQISKSANSRPLLDVLGTDIVGTTDRLEEFVHEECLTLEGKVGPKDDESGRKIAYASMRGINFSETSLKVCFEKRRKAMTSWGRLGSQPLGS